MANHATPGPFLSAQPNVSNLAPNGGFNFWQAIEGTATDVTTGNSTYGPDWWYLKNGSGDTCTVSRQTALVNGGTYGCKAIYKAATTPTSNGLELYYILPNLHSAPLYGVPLSLSLYGIAFGLTTQIGISFFSKTTEAKLDTIQGGEIILPVNTTAMTQGVVQNVVITSGLGTAPNVAGCLGIRVRCMAASTGGVFAAGNGFQVEQLMLTASPYATRQFSRYGITPANELDALQFTFQKNFPLGTAPAQSVGTATYNLTAVDPTGVTGTFGGSVNFQNQMRANPTITTYNPGAANANWRDTTNSADRTVTVTGTPSLAGFQLTGASGVAAAVNAINWQASAAI